MKCKGFIVWLLILSSCSVKNNLSNEETHSKDSINVTMSDVKIDKPFSTKKLSANEKYCDTLVYGKKWSDIELSGDPDTALALFVYRIIFTDKKEDADDCMILMNVYESTPKTLMLLNDIFTFKMNIYAFAHALDSLNSHSEKLVSSIVEKDLEDFGESDGPCFEFYKKIKK